MISESEYIMIKNTEYDKYIEYLKKKRNKADNTITAYKKDIAAFDKFCTEFEKNIKKCTENDALAYVGSMEKNGRSKSTINRRISSLRTFYDYLIFLGEIQKNPFEKIKASKVESRRIDYLTIEQVEKLIESTGDDIKGMRDRTILEFMYGTGGRVTEVVRLTFADINLNMAFTTLKDSDEDGRVVPIGSYAMRAMEEYISRVYPVLTGREPNAEDYVFVNMKGKPLTRQGIWKILKEYGDAIGEKERMTPQILRDSFAVHILQNGADLKTLQEIMGFEDMMVGISYLAVTKIHVKDVFSRTHPRA